MRDTDKAWQKWGASDPYYGVLTADEFRGSRLDADARTKFFDTGEKHFQEVIGNIRVHLDTEFSPERGVDFGCGAGRVLVAMARVCSEATGLDVSESMLSECRANCRASEMDNVVLGLSDDELSTLNGQYDLIHSYIVFQHIPTRRGERVFRLLLDHLANDGIAVVHFTTEWDANIGQRIAYFIRHHVPLGHALMNILRGRRAGEPRMEMNMYKMDRLNRIAAEAGCRQLFSEPVVHGAHHGAVLYLHKA